MYIYCEIATSIKLTYRSLTTCIELLCLWVWVWSNYTLFLIMVGIFMCGEQRALLILKCEADVLVLFLIPCNVRINLTSGPHNCPFLSLCSHLIQGFTKGKELCILHIYKEMIWRPMKIFLNEDKHAVTEIHFNVWKGKDAPLLEGDSGMVITMGWASWGEGVEEVMVKGSRIPAEKEQWAEKICCTT